MQNAHGAKIGGVGEYLHFYRVQKLSQWFYTLTTNWNDCAVLQFDSVGLLPIGRKVNCTNKLAVASKKTIETHLCATAQLFFKS